MRPRSPLSLRARVLALLAESSVPAATTEIAAACAAAIPKPCKRTWAVLRAAERRGLVLRLPPWPRLTPDRGRRAVRWALTPAGLIRVTVEARAGARTRPA